MIHASQVRIPIHCAQKCAYNTTILRETLAKQVSGKEIETKKKKNRMRLGLGRLLRSCAH